MGGFPRDIILRAPPADATPEEAVAFVDPALHYDGWLADQRSKILYRVRIEGESQPLVLKVARERNVLHLARMEHRASRDLTSAKAPCIPRFRHSYWPREGGEGCVALLREYVDGELLNAASRPKTLFNDLQTMSIYALGAKYGLPVDLHDRQVIVDRTGTPYLIDLEEMIDVDGFSREAYGRDLELLQHLERQHRKMTGPPPTRWSKAWRLLVGE